MSRKGRRGSSVVVDIPLGKGVSEHVDARNLNQPALLEADNAIFTKAGSLRKRRGIGSLATTSLPTSTSGLNRVFERESYPVLYGKGSVESLSEADAQWHEADNINAYPAEVEYVHGFAPTDSVDGYDAAVGSLVSGDILCEVWTSASKCWYRITDYGTKAIITPPTVVVSINDSPSVVWNEQSSRFLLFGLDGVNLYSAYMTPATAFTWSTPTAISTNTDHYAVVSSDDASTGELYMAAATNTTSFLAVLTLNTSGAITATSVTSDTVNGPVSIWVNDAADEVFFAGVNMTNGTTVLGECTTSLGSLSTTTGLLTSTMSAVDRASVAVSRTEAGDILIATSYVDDTVSETAHSPSLSFSFSHTNCETKWQVYDTSFSSVTGLQTMPWYVLTSQFAKESGSEPLALISYFYRIGDGNLGIEKTVTQRFQLLLTIDLATESLSSETGLPSGTVAAYPIVVAKVNTDRGDAESTLSTEAAGISLPHLSFPEAAKVLLPTLSLYSSRPDYHFGTRGSTDGVVYAEGNVYDQILLGTRLYRVDVSPPPVRVVGGAGTSIINAGYVQGYDGVTLCEGHLFARPEIVLPKITLGGSGTLDVPTNSGTARDFEYWFRVVNTYRDANGIEHRGEPSDPFRVMLDSADSAGNGSFDITVTAPGITHVRNDRGTRPMCQLYFAESLESIEFTAATDANDRFPVSTDRNFLTFNSKGGPYRLVTEKPIPQDARTVNFVWDAQTAFPDAAVSTNALLYTEGGVLASVPPPALLDVVRLPDAIVGISAENPFEILRTKRSSFGMFPEWNPVLSTILSPTITFEALAAMDEKTLVFSRDNVYILPESTVDNAGQGDLPPPQLLSSDTGCINRRTVVEGPFGVMFQGQRGFYVVDRGLSLHYVGGPVEDTLLGKTVNSAVLVPYNQVIRFTTDEGTLFEYDYERDNWSHRDTKAGTADTVNDLYVYGKNTTNGWRAFREASPTSPTWADEGSDQGGTTLENELMVETSWIKLTGLQGYKRVRKVNFLGEYKDSGAGTDLGGNSTGGLSISLYYDYDPQLVETYGYAVSDDNHDAGDPIRISFRPGRGKCQAIKIRITESASTNSEGSKQYGEGFVISGLSLEVEAEDGSTRDRTQTPTTVTKASGPWE